jgi:uncharacterized protein (DUF1684 family)
MTYQVLDPAVEASGQEDFAAAWRSWHDSHEARRADRHGFLAVTHLHWLDEAPQRLDGIPGLWQVHDDAVHLVLAPDEVLLRDGQNLNPDRRGANVRFEPIPERGGLDLVAGETVIELARRGGAHLLRPRSPHNPLLLNYRGTPTYAPDRRYVAAGTFTPFDVPRPTTVGAAVEGIQHVYEAPGVVSFELEGQQLSLTAFNGAGEGSLLFLFTDTTGGVTTYPANRSLTVAAPGPDGRITLDFNRAVNLPCAYTDLATCPLPPAENRLPIPIAAGEKLPYERQDPQ